MTIDEMKARKRELGYSNLMISQKSGVPLGTVQKIFSGITRNPRRDTITALEKLLQAPSYSQAADSGSIRRPEAATVREGAVKYSAQPQEYGKQFTIDDYYALPEEHRAELIDGVFYDMASPTVRHQAVLGALYLQFAYCIEKHPGCRVYFAPLDVRLDRDQWTMVQPDLIIICDRDPGNQFFDGAPDFVAEVLSPSTRGKDMFLKLGKYKAAGVREYWIIDPDAEKVILYGLEQEEVPSIFSFDEKVPVNISGGKCSIDFREVRRFAGL